MAWTPKRVGRENHNRIIQLLSQKPLTFKEVIEKSELSRSVVNQHLKTLEEERLIKKVYESGKILNVLQVSRIDLVEWFLAQLVSLGLPKEIVEKGRTVLNGEVLINSSFIYSYIWLNIIDLYSKSGTPKMEGTLLKLPLSFPKSKITFSLKIYQKEYEETVRTFLGELNPYTFNVVLTDYEIEKALFEKPPEEFEEREKFFFSEMPDNLKENFDKTSEWWFNDVSEYLPSSKFFQVLTFIYFSTFFSARARG